MKNAAVGGLVITKVYAGKITQKRVNFMVENLCYIKSQLYFDYFFLILKNLVKLVVTKE